MSSQHKADTKQEATPASTSKSDQPQAEAQATSNIHQLLTRFHAPGDDPTTRIQRQTAGRQLAQRLGNRRFSQLVQDQRAAPATIQRLPPTPAPAAGVTPPAPSVDKAIEEKRKKFLRTTFLGGNKDFDLKYEPNPAGPDARPIAGSVTITLKVHIIFRDFKASMMADDDFKDHTFTDKQKKDFKWKPGEETKFRDGFLKSVHDGWSTKHLLKCKSADFDDFVAGVHVNVKVVDSAAKAHTVITAQKVPKGAPRLRSFVQGGQNKAAATGQALKDEHGNPITRNVAHLDWRDPLEKETFTTDTPERLWRVAPFEDGKSDVNPTLQGVLDGTVIPGLRSWQTEVPAPMRPPEAPLGPSRSVHFVGRGSSSGGKGVNTRLGQRRADAVAAYVSGKLSVGATITSSEGKAGTGAGEEFRRVDVMAYDANTTGKQVKQDVAAHEAGHMLGLDDEYADAGADRLIGDHPEHYGDVQAQLGVSEAEKTTAANSENIMATGSKVQPGHYVMFIKELEDMTKLDWTI